MAAKSTLSLKEFCKLTCSALGLPDFKYDAENEAEWGSTVKDGVEYNISRPYKESSLHAWDATVPIGFNFGIALVFPKVGSHLVAAALVEHVGGTLCKELQVPVAHHRTWLGVGDNVPRSTLFTP